MRFLTDQDVYSITVKALRDNGHDVIQCSELGLSRAADEVILARSKEEGRILVTRDRDFGTLVFAKQIVAGVIYLRILPSTLNAVHAELNHVLMSYDELQLSKSFVVVEPGGHRIRRLAS
jgi:predicted nuclease of predicted toxin-antitoxin system